VTEVYHQLQEEVEIVHLFEDTEMIAFLLHGDGKGIIVQERFLNIQRGNLLFAAFRHLHFKMKVFVLAINMILLVQKNVMIYGIIHLEAIIMKI
jgi:hypothetical protein